MSVQSTSPERRLTAELVAEAAAWLAILHGPNRTAATEKGFSQWLKANPDNARAFEEATEIWEESRNLPRPVRLTRAQPTMSFARAAVAVAAVVLVAIASVLLYFRYAGVATGIGEQRMLALEDGSRIILNTATRLIVSYDSQYRRVELKKGEALFEVAKQPDRPFMVIAGDRQITALGTAFAVRRDDRRLVVTLVEGRVTVASVAASEASQSSLPRSSAIPQPEAVTLAPGERVIFEADREATLDRPELGKVLAWQRREVALDDTPLPDAIAEMNRYSTVRLVIDRPEAQQVRVTGLFRAGDSLSFARAVAEAYQLDVVEEPQRIVLVGTPAQRVAPTPPINP